MKLIEVIDLIESNLVAVCETVPGMGQVVNQVVNATDEDLLKTLTFEERINCLSITLSANVQDPETKLEGVNLQLRRLRYTFSHYFAYSFPAESDKLSKKIALDLVDIFNDPSNEQLGGIVNYHSGLEMPQRLVAMFGDTVVHYANFDCFLYIPYLLK
ncbi:MAG: hypothetical protein ABIQ27_12945 [Flavobacterium sp.]|uniref:hypothetical protein n=1 Tax=Flavobacterium sp. TaxID=239 RepID=UPI0032673D2B